MKSQVIRKYRVLHLLDHLDFIAEAPLVLVDRFLEEPGGREALQSWQPVRESLAHDVLEIVVEGETGRDVEVGQVIGRARQIDVAALGNSSRVRQRVGKVLEDVRHFLGSLQVELVAVVPQALGVVDRLAGSDAEQHVVRLEV